MSRLNIRLSRIEAEAQKPDSRRAANAALAARIDESWRRLERLGYRRPPLLSTGDQGAIGTMGLAEALQYCRNQHKTMVGAPATNGEG